MCACMCPVRCCTSRIFYLYKNKHIQTHNTEASSLILCSVIWRCTDRLLHNFSFTKFSCLIIFFIFFFSLSPITMNVCCLVVWLWFFSFYFFFAGAHCFVAFSASFSCRSFAPKLCHHCCRFLAFITTNIK